MKILGHPQATPKPKVIPKVEVREERVISMRYRAVCNQCGTVYDGVNYHDAHDMRLSHEGKHA